MPAADYASFLVRCWRAPDGGQRIVIEHVQSGERVAVPNIGAALGWIATWVVPPSGRVEQPRGTEEDEMANRRSRQPP